MDADALIQSASAREELACDVYCQFQTFDADHSGHLGFRELGLALRQLFKEAGLKKSPDFNTLEESFGAADTDGDNKISLEEFVAWYNHTIEWTARLHAEEAQEEEAQEAKKEKPATTLGRTESKLVFDLKMHDLKLDVGYWRSDIDSAKPLLCPTDGLCLGGQGGGTIGLCVKERWEHGMRHLV